MEMRRLGMAAMIAAGCLVALQTMNGCGGSESNNTTNTTTTDGGTKTDGGTTTGGGTTTDGGMTPTDGGTNTGTPGTAFNACATGNTCSDGSTCAQVSQTVSVCVPSCDAQGNGCPAEAFCALQTQSGGTYCAPTCNTNADCAVFGTWECTDPGNGMKLCLPPGSGGGGGGSGTQQPGQECGQTVGGCVSGAACVLMQQGATTGRCFIGPCTTDADCSAQAGAKCNVPLQNGSKICALDCTTTGTCANGGACTQVDQAGTKACL